MSKTINTIILIIAVVGVVLLGVGLYLAYTKKPIVVDPIIHETKTADSTTRAITTTYKAVIDSLQHANDSLSIIIKKERANRLEITKYYEKYRNAIATLPADEQLRLFSEYLYSLDR